VKKATYPQFNNYIIDLYVVDHRVCA